MADLDMAERLRLVEQLRAIDLEIAELKAQGNWSKYIEIEETTVDLESEEERQRKFEKEVGPIGVWLIGKIEGPVVKFGKWSFEKMQDNFDFEKHKPRRTKVWGALGVCSWGFTFCCGVDPRYRDERSLSMNWLHFLYTLSVAAGYPILLFYLYNVRDPLHYVLRRSHKQLLESTLVLVSLSWVYCTPDDPIDLSITVPALCLDVIPCLNLWWNFDNFGFFDSCLLVLILAVLLFCRDRGVVALMAVAVAGLALQFIKNAYRQYCSDKIKNQALDHVV